MPSPSLSFALKIQPHPRMVSIIRRFVEESFEKLVGDPEAVFRVSLAVHELLENAAKYMVSDGTAEGDFNAGLAREAYRGF